MDSDRKSTVSSFYGRKGSLDALNSDYPSPTAGNFGGHPGTHGRDDASSFFQPDRAPRNVGTERFGTAGYNRNSFFDAGREEPLKGGRDEEEPAPGDDGWDVYADFNNAGPRYSSAFTQNFGQGNDGYRPLEGTPKTEQMPAFNSPVELVTVPALGPEWQRSELEDMTKAGRKEKKADSRRQNWKAWNRDQRGLFGKKWLTRKNIVIFFFVLCVIIVVVLVFTIPRAPNVAINGDHPLTAATGSWNSSIPTLFSVAPANFSFPAFASLQLDTGATFLPLTFTHMRAQVIDSETNALVATGDLGHATVPAKRFYNILLPLNFTYSATNSSDETWKTWHAACMNSAIYPNNTRPGLNFRLVLDMSINGLVGSQGASTLVNNANCPVELPLNAG